MAFEVSTPVTGLLPGPMPTSTIVAVAVVAEMVGKSLVPVMANEITANADSPSVPSVVIV